MVSYLQLPGCFHPLKDAEGPDGGDGDTKMEEGEGKEKRREKKKTHFVKLDPLDSGPWAVPPPTSVMLGKLFNLSGS